jgi:hypothetical protein
MMSFAKHYCQSLGLLTPEDGTDRFSRKVGKKLPLLAA